MPAQPKSVLVFKTNLKEQKDIHAVKDVLDAHRHITRWSIDTGDEDCVLRLETTANCTNDIIQLIEQNGYKCAELE